MYSNRSLEFQEFCNKMYNTKAIVPIALGPANVIGSALVLRAIYVTRELNKINTFHFIANLSISDLMVTVMGLPLLATLKFHSNLTMPQVKTIEAAYKVFFDTKRFVSAFTLISLSIDKVLACIFHLKYSNYFTTFRTFLLIFFIWLFSLSLGAINWAVSKEMYPGFTCQPVKLALDVTGMSIILACFVVIFSSNVYLILLSRSHQKKDREQRREENPRARRIYQHYKSLKSLALIICMFGIGQLPLVLYFISQQFIRCTTLSCTTVWEYMIIIHYFDLNTRYVVYCVRFKSLCRSVLKIAGCNKLRRVRVAPDAVSNEKEENGVIAMVTERALNETTNK